MRKLTITLLIIFVIGTLLVISSCGQPEATRVPTATPTIEEFIFDFGVRSWSATWTPQVKPTATYIVPGGLATVTPDPFLERDTRFPKLYGIILSNTDAGSSYFCPTVVPPSLKEVDIFDWFDVFEFQFDIANGNASTVLQNCEAASKLSYATESGESFIDYIMRGDGSEPSDATFFFGRTYHMSDNIMWDINNSGTPTNTGLPAAPTSTPTPGGSWIESPNYDDLYAMRRLKGWLANDKNTSTYNCDAWHLCDGSDTKFAWFNGRDEAILNTYNGTFPGASANEVDGERYAEWSCNYIDATNRAVDGIRDDMTVNHPYRSYISSQNDLIDVDNNGVNDLGQFGQHNDPVGCSGWNCKGSWEEVNLVYNYGRYDWANCIRDDGLIFWGNGIAEPSDKFDAAVSSFVYPGLGSADGFMIEQADPQTMYWKEWDNYLWTDPSDYPSDANCRWGCLRQVIHDWLEEGRYGVFLGAYLSGSAGTYGNAEQQSVYNFASNIQQDIFSGWTEYGYNHVVWKDYYSVKINAGNTDCDAEYSTEGLHWLGEALEDSKQTGDSGTITMPTFFNTTTNDYDDAADYAWGRKFEYGYVAINPSSSAKTVTLPDDQSYMVAPGSDLASPNNQYDLTAITTDIEIPANRGVVLCNITAMSSTPTPVPIILTPTPVTPTPARPS